MVEEYHLTSWSFERHDPWRWHDWRNSLLERSC